MQVVIVFEFILPTLKSILPRICPVHHVRDITCQAILPLFLRATLKSWESGPGVRLAYACDDLCRKLETIFNHLVKGAE